MAIYEYRCPTCLTTHDVVGLGVEKDVYDTGRMVCKCGGQFKRRFSFTTTTDSLGGDGYFDPGVGQFVRTKRQLDDACKAASEHATAETGLEHRYVATPASDVKATISDEGMRETHDLAVKEGRRDATSRVLG